MPVSHLTLAMASKSHYSTTYQHTNRPATKPHSAAVVKPKFHYANFATKSGTSVTDLLRTQIMKVRDTNHVADFYDLCPWQVCDFVGNLSWTSCRRLSLCIVMDQIPLERHKRVCRGLVTDFVANISTSRDGLCPRLSWFVSMTFPMGKFRWKSE